MNGTQPVRLLADLGKVAAVNRLKELADQGMYVFQDERFALCLAKHALRTRSLDATVDLYPLWRGQRKYCDDSGIFAEMHLPNILNTCYAADAAAFLIQHAYNGHLFWQNICSTLDFFFLPPYSLRHVPSELIEKRSPLELASRQEGDAVPAQLQSAAIANGGALDPNKLPAPLAYDLIRAGFLLSLKTENRNAPTKLVVSPIWEHLLADINSPADTTAARPQS